MDRNKRVYKGSEYSDPFILVRPTWAVNNLNTHSKRPDIQLINPAVTLLDQSSLGKWFGPIAGPLAFLTMVAGPSTRSPLDSFPSW